MTGAGANAELVELGDLDELTRHVDRLCAADDWDGLVDLRDRCRKALERGKQLWPAASHAEYRLALEAPGSWAALVLEPGAGHFSLGPLTEVTASTHGWADLAPHVASSPLGALAAHERVVRGEDLTTDTRAVAMPPVLDLPLCLEPWEPAYPLAEYAPHEAHFPDVRLPTLERVTLPARVERAGDAESCRALVELASVWATQSNGRAEAVAARGDAPAAIAALGVRVARIARVELADAMAAMAWTAASGGAHGRRRGMAPGRFAAWWAAAAISGLLDHWPVPADELGDAAGDLRWYRWDAAEPVTGWSLRLAVEDPAEGLAWALAATDAT
ncbi:MAG: hypothetical protein E6G17_05870 [Actinobacteria bacterium]|nr:MAG: hypothetical protein E6G17_05870 [Actinomycetota bacterium]